MELIKKTIHILSILCYIIIATYALICLPILFGYKPLVVLTGSMEPTYKVGSVVYYKKVPETELKVGDVISFKYERVDYITHRIHAIENGHYTTKGDANNTPDSKQITYQDIHGKVGKIYLPVVGHAVTFINKHFYLASVLIAIMVAEFLFNNIKAFQTPPKEKKHE